MSSIKDTISTMNRNLEKIKKIAQDSSLIKKESKATKRMSKQLKNMEKMRAKKNWKILYQDIKTYRGYVEESLTKGVEKVKKSINVLKKDQYTKMMSVPLNYARSNTNLWLDAVTNAIEYQQNKVLNDKKGKSQKKHEERFALCQLELDTIEKVLGHLEIMQEAIKKGENIPSANDLFSSTNKLSLSTSSSSLSSSPSVENLTASKSLSPTTPRSLSPTTSQSLSPTTSQSLSPTTSQSLSPTTSQSLSPSNSQSFSPEQPKTITADIYETDFEWKKVKRKGKYRDEKQPLVGKKKQKRKYCGCFG